MEVSKIQLSSAEVELMQNADVILTKNRVLEKMRFLFEDVQHRQTSFSDNLTGEYFNISPKISKGENYQGLPYLILDYPRHSCGNQFFFIRTMFWWGKFFSCTLHLSGETKKLFEDRIKLAYAQLKNFYISTDSEQWAHHLEEPQYGKIDAMSQDEFDRNCEKFDHIKIASKHSLMEWEGAPSELYAKWKFFLQVCGLVS